MKRQSCRSLLGVDQETNREKVRSNWTFYLSCPLVSKSGLQRSLKCFRGWGPTRFLFVWTSDPEWRKGPFTQKQIHKTLLCLGSLQRRPMDYFIQGWHPNFGRGGRNGSETTGQISSVGQCTSGERLEGSVVDPEVLGSCRVDMRGLWVLGRGVVRVDPLTVNSDGSRAPTGTKTSAPNKWDKRRDHLK